MNRFHQELLAEMEKHKGTAGYAGGVMGTQKTCYQVNIPYRRKIARNFIKKHPELTLRKLIDLLDSLFAGKSHEEVTVAGLLLEYLPKIKEQLDPRCLDHWLNYTEGWCEVDTLCQSNWTGKIVLLKWPEWKGLLNTLAVDKNVHKRRASLVILNKAVRQSDDTRLSKMAFRNIGLLKKEKDILITKAISWLLRSLIEKHRMEVEKYLQENRNSLPKIAVREVNNKLTTGKKYTKS